jgi:hypothetical protein
MRRSALPLAPWAHCPWASQPSGLPYRIGTSWQAWRHESSASKEASYLQCGHNQILTSRNRWSQSHLTCRETASDSGCPGLLAPARAGQAPCHVSELWSALRHGAQLARGLVRRAAQIEQDYASCIDQYYRSRHGLISLGHLSHLGCHTEKAPVGKPGATNLRPPKRPHTCSVATIRSWPPETAGHRAF